MNHNECPPECVQSPKNATISTRHVIPVEAVEELAELIARRRYAKDTRPSVWITGRAAREVAGVILAAGYIRPDSATTREDLNALPTGSLVIDGAGNIYRKLDHNDGPGWYEPGEAIRWDSLELDLPATVLHIGGAE